LSKISSSVHGQSENSDIRIRMGEKNKFAWVEFGWRLTSLLLAEPIAPPTSLSLDDDALIHHDPLLSYCLLLRLEIFAYKHTQKMLNVV